MSCTTLQPSLCHSRSGDTNPASDTQCFSSLALVPERQGGGGESPVGISTSLPLYSLLQDTHHYYFKNHYE